MLPYCSATCILLVLNPLSPTSDQHQFSPNLFSQRLGYEK